MRRYRHAAVLAAGMLFVLPTLSSAQDTDPIPGLDILDVEVSVDIPDIPDIPIDLPTPALDFSLSLDVPIFDVDVEVQLAPGDPIPDVDVTLKSKVGGSNPPPPPPPDDECSEDGCD